MRHMSARLNRFRDEEAMGNGLREVWRVSVEVWPIASPRLENVFLNLVTSLNRLPIPQI